MSAKNVEIFRSFTAPPSGKRRRLVFHFLKSPVRLLGEGRLKRLVLERNRLQGPAFKQVARGTGETEELSCRIVFRSIGYKGLHMAGVPFDEQSGVIPNRSGRVQDANGSVVPQLCDGPDMGNGLRHRFAAYDVSVHRRNTRLHGTGTDRMHESVDRFA